MAKRSTQENPRTPKMWLGILSLAAGIFCILVYSNIIPSEESSFDYGRLPVLFIGLMFTIMGIIVILYNKGIKIPGWASKIIFLLIAACTLAPFHIILYMNYNPGSPVYDFIHQNFGMLLITAIFDLLIACTAIYFIYILLKKIIGQKDL
jgi:hypothetical protein